MNNVNGKNMITDFKFFNKPTASLDNEQIIRFQHDDRGFCEYRTITWRETIHMDRTRFRRRDFIGTMFEFFSNKPFIVPIAFIETTYGHHMCKELNGVGVESGYVFGFDTQVIIHWYETI